MPLPSKFTILGIPISSTSYAEVIDCVRSRPRREALVIACCNVHSVMSARRDSALRSVLQDAQITTPDGMPLVWALQWLHGENISSRVYGPDLMLELMSQGHSSEFGHFLLGSTTDTLKLLSSKLVKNLPGLNICGMHSPPFTPLDDMDVDSIVRQIQASKADIIWFGLGMPKQELLMQRLRSHLPGRVLIGVGAAFDFHSGKVPQAPSWMQSHGLEWAYRLYQEPRRLAGRYLWNNPAFVCLFIGNYLQVKLKRN